MPPAGSLVAKYEQGYASLCKHIFAVRCPSPFAFGWVGYCDWKKDAIRLGRHSVSKTALEGALVKETIHETRPVVGRACARIDVTGLNGSSTSERGFTQKRNWQDTISLEPCSKVRIWMAERDQFTEMVRIT